MIKTQDLIGSVYGALTSFGPTRLIPKSQMVWFVNFALADVWTYDGRAWAFSLTQETCEPQVADGTNVKFAKTLQYPIYKIKSCWDIKDKTERRLRILSEMPPELGSSSQFPNADLGQWSVGMAYYVPFNRTIWFYNNSLPDGAAVMTTGAGYKLNYHRYFDTLTGAADEVIPLPDHFLGALHTLTLSYCVPQYLQLGDGKEINMYQKGMAMLANLAKTDNVQTQQVTSNIH